MKPEISMFPWKVEIFHGPESFSIYAMSWHMRVVLRRHAAGIAVNARR
jgi:hypothetical protein